MLDWTVFISRRFTQITPQISQIFASRKGNCLAWELDFLKQFDTIFQITISPNNQHVNEALYLARMMPFYKSGRFILAFSLLLLCRPLLSQSQMNTVLTARFEDLTLYEIFGELEQKTGIQICTEPNALPWYRLSYSFEETSLYGILKKILPENGLSFVKLDEQHIAICQPVDLNAAYLKSLHQKCLSGEIPKPEFLQPTRQQITLGSPSTVQKTVKISGSVLDAENSESIAGAQVMLMNASKSVSTNALGQFTLECPAGESELRIRFIGYREAIVDLSAWQDGQVEIPISAMPQALREVTIQGSAALQRTRNTLPGLEALPVQQIRDMPALLGEADVIRGLQTLAGVTSAGEGSTGYNVRGGNTDQNLMLQDNSVVFNTSHVLGFFSAYNPDLVRSVNLYKGHVPAQFGGRLSSVLDVRLRDGDFQKNKGLIGAGPASARFYLEGPLWKNKISYLIGARRSYSDWMLKYSFVSEGAGSSAWFFDGLTKISVKFSDQVQGSVSVFGTNDFFRFGNSFGYQWNNRVINSSLRHPIGEKMAATWQASFSRYEAGYFTPEGFTGFELNTGLEHQNALYKITWAPDHRHECVGGVQWNRFSGLPEQLSPKGNASLVLPRTVPKDRGEDWAAFLQDEWKISKNLTVSMGLRGVLYRNLGEKTVYTYRENAPILAENRVDSTFYKKNETVQWRNGLEPRLSLNYRLTDQQALKISYNRLRQYIHLLSNLTAPTPTDIWQVSTPNIAPQTGDNLNLGYVFENKQIELSTDAFYKWSRNVPVFKNLPQLLLNAQMETEILPGEGRIYGFETSIKKKTGDWTGWLTYTWLRTWIRTSNATIGEQINNGDFYPSDYDQPHQVNIFAKYAFNPAANFSVNGVYRTGRPVSGPQNTYTIGGIAVPDFGERNNLRIPDYIRVDLAINVDQNRSKISGVKPSLSLVLYNVLGRDNPFSVFFRREADTYPKAYKLSVIGATIPAINLSFSW